MNCTFRPIKPDEFHYIESLIRSVEWPEHYVGVHTVSAKKVGQDEEVEVYLAELGEDVVGFISLKHQKINFLTYVSTLVVAKSHQGKGIGRALMQLAEDRSRARGNRGVYLDTPDNNEPARSFYKAVGYDEAYTMPYYYSDDLHGVAYQKFFQKI